MTQKASSRKLLKINLEDIQNILAKSNHFPKFTLELLKFGIHSNQTIVPGETISKTVEWNRKNCSVYCVMELNYFFNMINPEQISVLQFLSTDTHEKNR